MGMTLWSSRWDHTAGYMAVLPTQLHCSWPEDSSSSVKWADLLGIDDWSRLMEMASSLPCSRDSRRCWRVDTSRESLLIEPSMLRTGLSVWDPFDWKDRAIFLFFKALEAMMRRTRQATTQSVTVSRMRCGSIGACLGLSKVEGEVAVEEERPDLR